MKQVFKIGDTVKMVSPSTRDDVPIGTIGTIIAVNRYSQDWDVDWGGIKGYECVYSREIELVSNKEPVQELPPKLPKFILQYELGTDPFELFTTEKELRARIKELSENRDLKRDSIKVYDISRVRTVELGVKITIK